MNHEPDASHADAGDAGHANSVDTAADVDAADAQATTSTTTDPDSGQPWDEFEARLVTTLKHMVDESYLILSTPESDADPGYYVQFVFGQTWGVRAEAVSNDHLPPARTLTPAQEERLIEFGWQRPGPDDRGHNFYRAWTPPVPFAEVARLAVRTLRDVYGISAPSELRYHHQAFEGGEVVQPELGIEVLRPTPPPVEEAVIEQSAAGLEPTVEAALRRFGLDRPRREAHGHYQIRVGSALLVIHILDGLPPALRIFSPLLHDIGETPALHAALNEINGQIRFGRVFWTERQVIVAMELTAVDITAAQIAFACVELGQLADHLDDGLHGRFGGVTMFATRAALVN